MDDNILIYKYIRLEYLLQWLRKKMFRLDLIRTWKDPFENFFLKQNFECDGKVVDMWNISEDIYGQSWTLMEESDAMWRIYSETPQRSCFRKKQSLMHSAIRVRTTPGKLMQIVKEKYIPSEQVIDIVQYKTDSELSDWLNGKDPIEERQLRKCYIESSFIKRVAFSHEREVRLIVEEPGKDYAVINNGVAYYSFIPDDVLEEYTLDPRLNLKDAVAIRKQLEKVGVPSDRICQSKLYSFSSSKIQIKK